MLRIETTSLSHMLPVASVGRQKERASSSTAALITSDMSSSINYAFVFGLVGNGFNFMPGNGFVADEMEPQPWNWAVVSATARPGSAGNSIYVNGVDTTDMDSLGYTDSSDFDFMLHFNGGQNARNGDLHELACYDHALSDDDRARVELFMANRVGVELREPAECGLLAPLEHVHFLPDSDEYVTSTCNPDWSDCRSPDYKFHGTNHWIIPRAEEWTLKKCGMEAQAAH